MAGMDMGSGNQDSAAGSGLLGVAHWFALVAALVLGGLFLAARAGDAYTHVSGLLFAGFGLLLGARVLHRTLP
jgi:hypothetical protein